MKEMTPKYNKNLKINQNADTTLLHSHGNFVIVTFWVILEHILILDLEGYNTPNQKLVCFVLYLKIINTFWKIIYACHGKFFKGLKNSIKI